MLLRTAVVEPEGRKFTSLGAIEPEGENVDISIFTKQIIHDSTRWHDSGENTWIIQYFYFALY